MDLTLPVCNIWCFGTLIILKGGSPTKCVSPVIKLIRAAVPVRIHVFYLRHNNRAFGNKPVCGRTDGFVVVGRQVARCRRPEVHIAVLEQDPPLRIERIKAFDIPAFIFAVFGAIDVLPPLVAAWAANILMALTGTWFFLRIQG